jgi:hypothetical protein
MSLQDMPSDMQRNGSFVRSIFYYDFGLESMDFFYNKCMEYLKDVQDMRWNSDHNPQIKDKITAFQKQCTAISLQLETAKQTEQGLNDWQEKLFDAHRKLSVACDPYRTHAMEGTDGDYEVLQDINKALEMCSKVIQEMLRILNPNKKEYKIWYAPKERFDFLREIGFLDFLKKNGKLDSTWQLTQVNQYFVFDITGRANTWSLTKLAEPLLKV